MPLSENGFIARDGALSCDVRRMNEYLERDYAPLKAKVLRTLAGPTFTPIKLDLSKEDHRARVLAQLLKLGEDKTFNVRDIKQNPKRYFGTYEALAFFDTSLFIKTAVQYSLWGGSVLNLGTEYHHKLYLDDIESLRLPGCFSMTELGHGSNVRGIETEAVYDRSTREFIVNTPNVYATKWWIGNAAAHGVMSTVFALLKIDGKDYGVHAFVVPIRNPRTMQLCQGVTIGDCGHKVGLNGIDNGWLSFDHVRIPRENLLNRFGNVSDDGVYSSPIPDPNKRFGAIVGELTGGRVGLTSGTVAILRLALTVAIRYGETRRQFGPPGRSEISILDYQTHQRKLMPILATSFAHDFAAAYLIDRYSARTPKDSSEVHSMSTGLKAVCTWYTAEALNVCREACGGHGYSSLNRLGQLRSDHDIFQTFEGDNTVLMQQVTKDLLAQYKRCLGGQIVSGTMGYLSKQLEFVVGKSGAVSPTIRSEADLLNPDLQLAAFQFRSAQMVHAAAVQLKHNMSAKKDALDAWNASLDVLIDTAKAHVDQLILDRFIIATHTAPADLRPVLKLVCDLYVVSRIDANLAAFLNHEYVQKTRTGGVRGVLLTLCAQLRPHALALVDSWNIPDFLVQAPLGQSRGDRYEHYYSAVGLRF